MSLRIATFNCENLLSRPKILSFDASDAARPVLEKAARLDAILRKAAYTNADRAEILRQLAALAPYLEIGQIRGGLLGRRRVGSAWQTYVRAAGRADWVGGLVFKRSDVSTAAQISTAEVLRAVNADVVCLMEVEDRITLERFAAANLQGEHAYPFNMLVDGNDDRGIDVAVLSRLPIRTVRTHVFDAAPAAASRKPSRIFSRDCLELEIDAGGRPLFVLVNHFKSQGYGLPAYNNARRKLQADRVAAIVRERYDLARDWIAVAGDFNDTPKSAPLRGLVSMRGLVDVLARQFGSDMTARWTYRSGQQLDYLLVSTPLARAMTAAGVERRGVYGAAATLGNGKRFQSVISATTAASDHGAVWAEFAAG